MGGFSLWLFNEARQERITQDAITYAAAIAACASSQRWRHALEFLQQMLQEKCYLDTISHGLAIDACGKTGYLDRLSHLIAGVVPVAGRKLETQLEVDSCLGLAESTAGKILQELQ